MRYTPVPTTAPQTADRSKRRTTRMLMVAASAAMLLTGCQTDGSSPLSDLVTSSDKKAEPATPPEPPMTRSRAAMECWMKTEKGQADANLDKRADAVNKCIDEKLKTAQAPKT